MAPREPREPRDNRPDQDSPYEDTTLGKVVETTTHGWFGADEADDNREDPESKDKRDDSYKPFQHTPGTGKNDKLKEDRAIEDLVDSKRHTDNTDRND